MTLVANLVLLSIGMRSAKKSIFLARQFGR
jgi:hypothetical protein